MKWIMAGLRSKNKHGDTWWVIEVQNQYFVIEGGHHLCLSLVWFSTKKRTHWKKSTRAPRGWKIAPWKVICVGVYMILEKGHHRFQCLQHTQVYKWMLKHTLTTFIMGVSTHWSLLKKRGVKKKHKFDSTPLKLFEAWRCRFSVEKSYNFSWHRTWGLGEFSQLSNNQTGLYWRNSRFGFHVSLTQRICDLLKRPPQYLPNMRICCFNHSSYIPWPVKTAALFGASTDSYVFVFCKGWLKMRYSPQVPFLTIYFFLDLKLDIRFGTKRLRILWLLEPQWLRIWSIKTPL